MTEFKRLTTFVLFAGILLVVSGRPAAAQTRYSLVADWSQIDEMNGALSSPSDAMQVRVLGSPCGDSRGLGSLDQGRTRRYLIASAGDSCFLTFVSQIEFRLQRPVTEFRASLVLESSGFEEEPPHVEMIDAQGKRVGTGEVELSEDGLLLIFASGPRFHGVRLSIPGEHVRLVATPGSYIDITEGPLTGEDDQRPQAQKRGRIDPAEYTLADAYPNPFNPRTLIRFDLPQSTRVDLRVYDVTGRLVRALLAGTLPAGTHEVAFEAHDLPSGLYLYGLTSPMGSIMKTMLLVK